MIDRLQQRDGEVFDNLLNTTSMKSNKLVMLALVHICSVNLMAQTYPEGYVEKMKSAYHMHDIAATYADESAVIEKYEQISEEYPSEWLPNYWSSYIYTQLGNRLEKTPDIGQKRTVLLNKAQEQLNLAKSKVKEVSSDVESDLHALQSLIYLFRGFGTDVESEKEKYGSMYKAQIAKALAKDSQNPLILVLMGTDLISDDNTLSQILSGHLMLKRADELFKAENTPRGLSTQFNREWLELFWLEHSKKVLDKKLNMKSEDAK